MSDAITISKHNIVRRWWVHLVRGVILIALAIFAIFWPIDTLIVLAQLVALFILVFGIFAFIAGLVSRETRWSLILEGVIGIVLGVFVLIRPDITLLIFAIFLAIWAIFLGILELVAAYQLKKVLAGDWILILSGILSILFGIILLLLTKETLEVLIWIIGFYALFFGVILCVFAFKLRSLLNKAK